MQSTLKKLTSSNIQLEPFFSNENVEGKFTFDIVAVDCVNHIVFGNVAKIEYNTKYWWKEKDIINHELKHFTDCLFHNKYFDKYAKLTKKDYELKSIIEKWSDIEIDINDNWKWKHIN